MSSKNNPTSKYSKIKVGLTMGDPSGIGPALILKAVNRLSGLADFVVVGDAWVLKRTGHAAALPGGTRLLDLNNVSRKDFQFGKVSAEYGRASIDYLEKSLGLIKNKDIDCLVTCPISKEAIGLAGLNTRGHTEFLAERTKTKDFAMLLVNKNLKICLATRHVPLKEVPGRINQKSLSKDILLTYNALKRLFRIRNPHIVVAGLNPHASDNGRIGNEENAVMKPVLKKFRKNFNLVIDGPLSADVAIYKANRGDYDCVIAMYHDQALIPLKLLGNDSGVNITIGLPFVRTSPLHGTAFDIAKKYPLINPNSLIEAIRIAVKCTLNLKKD